MTPKEKATYIVLMVLKQLTGPRMTLTGEQLAALVQESKDACAAAGVNVADVYSYVVSVGITQ